MAILDGAAYLGFASGSTGTPLVTGEGSQWTNSNDLAFGGIGGGEPPNANGTLTIADGTAFSGAPPSPAI